MKKTLLILVVTAMYFAGNAQSKNSGRFSIGFEAGVPVGENGKPYANVLGGSLQYEIKPDADLGITVNGGYLHYAVKSSYGGGSTGFVPLLAGVKYYFTPGAFIHAQLGAAVGTATGQGTSFAYTPGVGFKIANNLDVEFKYFSISNSAGSISDVGARLAYNF